MSLLIEIDRFLRERNMPVTTFGRLAVGDPRLVGDMRRGRRLGERVAARVETFLSDPRR